MEIGEILRLARQSKGYSLRDVVAKTGVKIASLSKIERGGVDSPGFFAIVKLAHLYGLDLYDLGSRSIRVNFVPVLKHSEINDRGVDHSTVPMPFKCSEDSYFIKVQGDSMEATSGLSFPEGSHIAVDPHVKIFEGCFAVFEGGLFRQVVKGALKPLNSRYKKQDIESGGECLGVVVGMLHKVSY